MIFIYFFYFFFFKVLCFYFFFFFQAEDGIRDGRVTGVQTCALPISDRDRCRRRHRRAVEGGRAHTQRDRRDREQVHLDRLQTSGGVEPGVPAAAGGEGRRRRERDRCTELLERRAAAARP